MAWDPALIWWRTLASLAVASLALGTIQGNPACAGGLVTLLAMTRPPTTESKTRSDPE